MNISLKDAENNFENLIKLLASGVEDSIIIFQNHLPLVELKPIKNSSRRVGVMKDKKSYTNLDDFNKIKIDDLFNN